MIGVSGIGHYAIAMLGGAVTLHAPVSKAIWTTKFPRNPQRYPTVSAELMLWDDAETILWDDSSEIAWDN